MKKLVFIFYMLLVLLSCKKSSTHEPLTITTASATFIKSTTAMSGGEIIDDGSTIIKGRGICWSTSLNPSFSNNYTKDGIGVGKFNSKIFGLLPSTTYYVKSYVINSTDTLYGNEISFTTSTPDVYVAGYESNGSNHIAMLWKNGIPTALTNGVKNAEASCVFVSDNEDVYVSGYESNGTNNVAMLWKNGISTALTNGVKNAEAPSVFVSDSGDVYVVGSEFVVNNTSAIIWKNMVPSTLPNAPNSLKGSSAHCVYVANKDVYVAGVEDNGASYGNKARVWKNNIPMTLTNDLHGGATAVFVAGADVYVTGYEQPGNNNTPIQEFGKLWKNGMPIFYTGSLKSTIFNSLFVHGSDIYLGGGEVFSSWAPRFWKNGTGTTLTFLGGIGGTINSTYVLGKDVYFAGFEFVNGGINFIPRLWKNGAIVTLTNGANGGIANSVFVK
jgi:hypothetical protein